MKIPPHIQHGAFCLIRPKDKRPFEPTWQKTPYRIGDKKFQDHINSGGNYGVISGYDGIVILDVDNVGSFKLSVDHNKIPNTFTVKTPGGGYHFYFVSPDTAEKIVLKDKDGLHVGELQAGGAQVVGAGSTHPNGGTYKVVNDVAIAAIPSSELYSILGPLIQKKTGREKLEEIEANAKKGRQPKDDDPFANVSILDVINTSSFEKSGKQLFGTHPIHGSETGHNLVIDPVKNSWWCGRCETGGGPAMWLAVEAGIIHCDEAKPGAISGQTFIEVLDYAKKKGIIQDDTKESSIIPSEYERIINVEGNLKIADMIAIVIEETLIGDKDAQMVYDQSKNPRFWIPVNSHHELLPFHSSDFSIWMCEKVHLRFDQLITMRSIKESEAPVRYVGEHVTKFKGLDIDTRLEPRTTMMDGSIYYDLCWGDWNCIKISNDGIEKCQLPMALTRANTKTRQIFPDLSAKPVDVFKMFDHIRLEDDADKLFVAVWMCTAYISRWSQGALNVRIPHPFLWLIGPPGSGKTILGEYVRSHVDPDTQVEQELPDSKRDLAIQLHHSRCVLFDNIDIIEPWQSKMFCMAATGGSYGTRTLYSDQGVTISDFNANVIFTSVTDPEANSDFLERTLKIWFTSIPEEEKKSKILIASGLEADRPIVFGAICNTLLEVIKTFSTVLEESRGWKNQVRMGDFAVIGECCCRAWGIEPGLFLKLYNSRMVAESKSQISEDTVIQTLADFVDTQTPDPSWEGLLSDLKKDVESYYLLRHDVDRLPKDWPAKPNKFSERIRNFTADLIRSGYKVNDKRQSKGSYWWISRDPNRSSRCNPSTQPTFNLHSIYTPKTTIYNPFFRENVDYVYNRGEENTLRSLESDELKKPEDLFCVGDPILSTQSTFRQQAARKSDVDTYMIYTNDDDQKTGQDGKNVYQDIELIDLISEHERQEKPINVPSVALAYHVPEDELCAALYERDWKEALNGGDWLPPSRTDKMKF